MTVSSVVASLVKSGVIVEEGLKGIVLEENVDVSVDDDDSCAFINAKIKNCKIFIAKRSQNTYALCESHMQIVLYECINNNSPRILFYLLR